MKRFLPTVLLILAACAPPPPTPTDTTPPALLTSIPQTGSSDVPTNVRLTLIFSEPIQQGSLELNSTPSLSLGDPTWNASGTSVAFDNAPLTASTPYTLTLKAKDIAGNALPTTTITFTTSETGDTTAPSQPTGLVATPANAQVALTWQANSESDVVGYTVYMGTAEDALEFQDFVTTTSKTFTGLTNGTPYFFAIDAVDAAHNRSSRTVVVSATPAADTDVAAPTLRSSEPADGATGVSPRNPVITLVFSKSMLTTDFAITITPPFAAIDAAPNEALELSWSRDDTMLTIRPALSELLPDNTLFTLTIERATDKSGRPLTGSNQLRFTTGTDAFRLIASSPAEGQTSVPRSPGRITLAFSEAVDPASFNAELYPSRSMEIDARLEWNETHTQVAFYLTAEVTPLGSAATNDVDFPPNRTFTFEFAGTSLRGRELLGSIQFATAPTLDTSPPLILKHSPPNGAVLPTQRPELNIVFSKEMDRYWLLRNTSIGVDGVESNSSFELLVDADDFGVHFMNVRALGPLTSGALVRVAINTEARDASGNRLQEPFELNFAIAELGMLQVNIVNALASRARVRVTGPDGYESETFGSSHILEDLSPGIYVITAEAYAIGRRCHLPDPAEDQQRVRPGETAVTTITYLQEDCGIGP